jgi:hypothetical protein
MSLHDCIQRAIDSGDLPPGRARAAQALFAARLKDHAHLGQGAEAAAAEDVWVHLRREAIRRRRSAVMQASAYGNIAEALARHRDSDGKANAASALRQLVEWGQSATHANVESTRRALEQDFFRSIGQLIKTHKRNILGSVRQKALTRLWVKELKGEGTGDPAAFSLAMAVRDTLERARQMFNAAGGDLAKLEGYDLPHRWDRRRVARLTPEAFATRFYDTQDWARITDRATDQPFAKSGKAERMDFLRRIHRNIVSGGWEIREPSGAGIGASLGKSRSDHRVLHFKDAESWFTANDEFGTADPFTAVVEHLSGMARDIAMMRTFGPNPEAGFEYARQAAMKLAQDRPWKPGKALGFVPLYSDAAAEVQGVAKQTRRMLDMVTGAANQPESDLFAAVMSATVRPFLVASQMGGAMLSAITDVGYMGQAAFQIGGKPGRVIGRHLKYVGIELTDTAVKLATLGRVDRARVEARLDRMGIIAEAAASTGVSQARILGEDFGPGIWQRLSELTLRASGLTRWTDIARGVSKMEVYGTLAENADRPLAEVDDILRMRLTERGFTADDWEAIRATELFSNPRYEKGTFLLPHDLRRRTDLDPDRAQELALKLETLAEEHKEFFVPSSSLRGRATLQVGAPGTVGGELSRSTLMYKNFPLTLMYNQMGRVLFHKVRGNRLANIIAFSGIAWLGGALTLQLQELRNGRDPRPMDNGTFWKAALLKGGGLGLFADFLYAAENRFGQGIGSTTAGPVVGAADRLISLTGAFSDALTEKDPAKAEDRWNKAQTEALRFANHFSGPTNLWYLGLALDRVAWDTLTEWADPDAPADFAKAEKKRIKEYQTPSYWPQGELLPPRLPDLSNMFGASP